MTQDERNESKSSPSGSLFALVHVNKAFAKHAVPRASDERNFSSRLRKLLEYEVAPNVRVSENDSWSF
jgi:hypothetical protein